MPFPPTRGALVTVARGRYAALGPGQVVEVRPFGHSWLVDVVWPGGPRAQGLRVEDVSVARPGTR